MGACFSKKPERKDTPDTIFTAEAANGSKSGPAAASKDSLRRQPSEPTKPESQPAPSGVQVEFVADAKDYGRSQSLGERWSRNASLQSEVKACHMQ